MYIYIYIYMCIYINEMYEVKSTYTVTALS